ncbi:MAG: PstS family phosphate ABC transporter substrate-binding protein [Halodesulfurarchaeum sp.]
MAHDGNRLSGLLSRRNFLATAGTAGAAALAGCSGSNSEKTTTGSGSQSISALEAGGSSTVFPIIDLASKYWNANPKASNAKDWPHAKYGIETSKNLADYWGSLYGFPTGNGGDPPFRVSVGLSHSGTGIEKLRSGQIDIGNSSAPVRAEKPGWDQAVYEKFVDHVIGVDGQPIVVSSEIANAGVTQISGDELKDIYKGRITNWSELGGPDRPIQVLGRVKGSGTRTAFVTNVFGDPTANTEVDNRFGQNQRLAQAIASANNAISYLALAFVDTEGVTPIALNWKGTVYKYGKNLGAKDYPLSRDLHAYTWKGTSKKEAAFLRMVLSDFGQATFVVPNHYFKLPAARQQTQLEKLPDPV